MFCLPLKKRLKTYINKLPKLRSTKHRIKNSPNAKLLTKTPPNRSNGGRMFNGHGDVVHEQPVDRGQGEGGNNEVLHPPAVRIPRSYERPNKRGPGRHTGVPQNQATASVSFV